MKSIRERIRRNPKVIRMGVSVMAATMALSGVSVYNVNAENQEIESVLSSIKTVQKDVGKKESVYFFTDASGKVTKTIVSDHLINRDKDAVIKDSSTLADIENVKGDETYDGSGSSMEWKADGADIYYQGTSTKKEPVTIKITYYLDGKETPASEMAGKSGKVRMRFDYTNNTSYTEKVDGQDVTVCVPLAAVTGILLEDNFSNVEVTNGEINSSQNGNLIIGYTMPGLKKSLEAGEGEFNEDVSLPEYFEVTADVKEFSMENTLTLVENATDVTTFEGGSDFSEIDSLLGELSEASEQLESGSSELADGISTLKDSLGTFKAGMDSLNSGVTDYTNGASQLESGIYSLSAGIDQLASQTPALIAGVGQLQGVAVQTNGGVNTIIAGMDGNGTVENPGLVKGAQALKAGTEELNTSIEAIVGGISGTAASLTTAAGNLLALKTGLETQRAALVEEGADPDADPTVLQMDATIASLDTAIMQITAMGTQLTPTALETLKSSVAQINAGAGSVQTGVESVRAGLGQVSQGTAGLEGGLTQLNNSTGDLQGGIDQLQQGSYSLTAGAGELTGNNSTLVSGVGQLVTGTDQIVTGVDALQTGAQKLKTGMTQFNEDAIQKMVGSYNGDIRPLTKRLKAAVKAGREYQTFSDLAEGTEGSVRFIYKTDAIKKDGK